MDIKKLADSVMASVKKNPWPYAAGGAGILGLIVYMSRGGSSSGGISYGAPEQPPVEDTTTPEGYNDEEIRAKLDELTSQNIEDRDYYQNVFEGIFEEMSRSAARYEDSFSRSSPYTQPEASPVYAASEPVLAPVSTLQESMENILSTPSIIFSPENKYTPSQVSVISDYATQEKYAISRGSDFGTSVNPKGLGESGMNVTYHSTGEVSFTPKSGGETARTSSNSGSSKLAAAGRVDTGSMVRKVTGKSGNVEKQLSGMSQSQKRSTLKKAGLI